MNGEFAQRPSDDELLAYVQETLPPEDMAKLRAALEADPALAADVAFMAGLKTAMQDAPNALTPPGEFGWHRLEAAIDQDAATQKPQQARPWMQYIAAGLACVCVLLGAALLSGTGTDQGRFEPASVTEDEFVLAVSFTAEMTAPELQTLLTDISGQIVGGPSQSGLYRIAFETSDQFQTALGVLDASPVIDLVAAE